MRSPPSADPKSQRLLKGLAVGLFPLAQVIAGLALTKHFNLNAIINAVITFAFFTPTMPALILGRSGSSSYSLWLMLIYHAFMDLSDQQVYLFSIMAVALVAIALALSFQPSPREADGGMSERFSLSSSINISRSLRRSCMHNDRLCLDIDGCMRVR